MSCGTHMPACGRPPRLPTMPLTPAAPMPRPRSPQSEGRASAQPPCSSLLQVPSCGRAGVAQLGGAPATPFVLEPSPAAGLFYMRAACTWWSPLYLGFHKATCYGGAPALFRRNDPSASFADLLWAVEPASQEVGAAQIDSVAVVAANIVRVLVRPVAGAGGQAGCRALP